MTTFLCCKNTTNGMKHEPVKKKTQNLKSQEQHQKTTQNQTLDSQNCDYTRFCFQSTGAQNKFPTMRRNYHAFSILLLVKYLHCISKGYTFSKEQSSLKIV